jgi:hypothetical protein
MKLPYKVKDTKSIQRNFDFLASKIVSGDPTAVPIVFAANWTDYATSVPDPGQVLCSSWKDLSGTVHVQGLARRINTAWAGSTVIGTLAAQHRPNVTTHGFICYSVDTIGGHSAWRVLIDPAGVITAVDALGSANGAAGSYIYLDGISFKP